MKKFTLAIATLAMLFSISSCGSSSADAATDVAEAISVDSIFVNPDALVGDTIVVEGVCSHLCKHGGKKAFLLGTDANTMIRCESTPEMGGRFPQESIHRPMRVTGVLAEYRLGENEIIEMEEQHAAQIAMIAEQQGAEQAAAVADAATGCDTERKARGQGDIDSFSASIADYRARIAERTEKEGKPYLSTYYIVTSAYEILPE